MAISLKEQLGQINQLQEVSYHAPIFDKHYYDKSDHSEGRKSGRAMFYDFYAMEFLWSFLGSGQIPKADRETLMGLPEDDPRRDIIQNKVHRFLPSAAVKVIDSMYEQVTNTVAKNLLAYVRLAVVQEFQYLVSQSHGWTQFRNSLVSKYNKNKTISKADFDALVKKHIPDMAPYPETIKRLLKYSKYYSEMHTSDDKDPFDVSRGVAEPEKQSDEPYPEFPHGQAAEEPKAPEEPDDTDYNAEPASREFGKYGGPGQPQAPYPQDWSGMSAFKDTGELPKIPSDDDEDEEGGKVKELLKEENINLKKVKKVYAAINKAGITLDDIEKAYNKIPWGGAYGGSKWGAGAVALLKLAHAKKNLSTEDMNHIIDHIYDLQHNTGSLLNKGPMYIDDTDLNRRYKISDVARFIPFVSPVIKNLILRFQRYLHSNPEKAAQEANMENLQKSPKLPLDPEDIKKLMALGFKAIGDNSYRVAIKFNNKKGESVSGVYYEVSKNDSGTFEKGKFIKNPAVAPMFVVSDNLKADVKAFPTFEEAFQYIGAHKQDMVPNGYVGGSHSGYAPSPIKSEKDMYLDSHTRIKLSPDKEQELLNINLGWRKKGKKYYKAYFPDGHRLHFYAFSDGSFLLANDNKADYFVYNTWPQAFNAATSMAAGAQEYPEKAEAQAEIDAALGKGQPAVTTAAGEPPVSKDYFLSSEEQKDLQTLISTELPSFIYDQYVLGSKPDGMVVVSRKKYHKLTPEFAVGKLMDAIAGKPYKVVHYLSSGAKESWPFGHWDLALGFIKQNINTLVNKDLAKPAPISQQPSSVTPTAYSPGGKQLPPHATSKASYTVHSGLESAPKGTIRLTKEDESALTAIGFEPRLVGSDVWYIHKFAGDTVKFFPNNTAKVLFTSKGSTMKVLGINGSIDKILAWLPTKYSLQTNKSPIDTGASTGVAPTPAAATTAPTSGIKAGVMFEKTITDAGFIWDSMGGDYVDYPNKNPGEAPNTLKIAPNRSSVLQFASGQTKYFKDLASLITYLKTDYLTQKKSSPVTQSSGKITVFPSWMNQKQVGMMEKAGFQYKGPVSDDGYSYKNTGGDTIIAYPTHIYKVFDAAHNNWVDLSSSEEFTTYLGEKFGSLPSTTIPVPPSENPNIMSKEEEDAIAQLVDGIPGLKFKKGYLTEAEAKKPQIQYVSISDAKGKPIFAVTKKRGKYVIYKVIGKTWDKVYEDEQFGGIKVYLESILKDFATTKGSTSQLSEDEQEWIEAYVKNKLPNIKISKSATGGIAIMDEEGDVFRVTKTKDTPYTVKYSSREYLPGYGYKFSFDTFKTFPELAAGIASKFETYTQVLAAKAKTTTGVSYLDEKLKQYGFNYAGPTSDGGDGTKKNGVVFDDAKHNRVIYYFDGTSITYLNDKESPKFGAVVKLSDIHGLLASLDEIFGTSGASESKRDEMFGALIEEAAQLGGTGGAVVMGTTFEGGMSTRGFEWDQDNNSYINKDLRQIVVVVNTGASYEYHVFFIDSKGNGKKETVDGEFLWDAIGPGGNLDKLKRKEKTPSVVPPGVAEPSGETYKLTDNEADAHKIKLNEHDAKLLEYCGFSFYPNVWDYRNADNESFRFYNTGKAVFYDKFTAYEPTRFKSIPHALKFAVAKYIAQTSPPKPTESSSPFSNQNYNANPTDEQLAPISLNIQDSDLLEKIGFKWNPKKHWYIKKLGKGELPALEEAGKKKKVASKPKAEQEYEIIYVWNSGNAAWTLTPNPETANPETDAKDGTIQDILGFVWHRWKGNEKPKTGTSGFDFGKHSKFVEMLHKAKQLNGAEWSGLE